MIKKWRILFICLLVLMSYSIYETSRTNVHIDLVSNALKPYTLYQDFNKRVSLLGADNTEDVKQDLMELSDSTQVSFTLSYFDPAQEHNAEYYWYLQDEKYLNTSIGLNKSIDLKTFNALKEPITNHAIDEYHFNFTLDTYNYKIYPFSLYDKSNLSTELTIFADSEQKINEFINGLRGLQTKGIVYVVNDPLEYQRSFLNSLRFTVYQIPLAPLTLGLFFIALFTSLYQDRRNLSIKLVNGYSKTHYILETIKSLLWLQTITFMGSFFAYYLLSFYFSFKHLVPILSHYIPIILIIDLVVMVFVAIIILSFTDINQNTYVQGVKPKALTSHIISTAKFVVGLLICMSLIPSVFQIKQCISIYQSLAQQTRKYSDIYILDSSGADFTSIMLKSDEIIEALMDFDNLIYISPFSSGETGESIEIQHKVVYVNHNYLKMHPIYDKEKNLIDPDKTNFVYTKAHNIKEVERLQQSLLSGSNEIITLDDDATLTLYSKNPLVNDDYLAQDFVLVPRNKGLFILEVFFVFKNNSQIEEVRNQLKDIVDIEAVAFKKVTDSWEQELFFHRSQIIDNAIALMNYFIITVVFSLIYYQIKFDKVRREFSIYWVNGVSKFNHFYADYFYQIAVSGIIIFLVKKLFYPDLSIMLTLIFFLIYICIDTLSLTIFRNQFYTQLQKNIKEQM